MLTMYTKAQCRLCEQSKVLLKARHVPFQEIKVDLDPVAREFLVSQGHKSVPQFYMDGQLRIANGYTGLCQLTEEDFTMLRGTHAQRKI